MAVKPLSQTVANIPHFKNKFPQSFASIKLQRTTTMVTKKLQHYQKRWLNINSVIVRKLTILSEIKIKNLLFIQNMPESVKYVNQSRDS